MNIDRQLRFAPSAVDGLEGVSEVTVFPDRMLLQTGLGLVTIRFANIARWRRFTWLRRLLARLGCGVYGFPFVADRDWFHPPQKRFFRFYSRPRITVFMPDEPTDLAYSETTFRRIQDIIAFGGFSTFDLG